MFFLQFLSFLPFIFFGAPQEPLAVAIQAPLHGIYLTSFSVANPKTDELLDAFLKVGGNLIVFDVQTSGGKLAYQSQIPLSLEIGNGDTKIQDLSALVSKLHQKGYYVAVRWVLFKNAFLAKKKPQWVLKRKGSNRVFVSRDGPVWLDPGNEELKKYYIDIADEIAEAGVDEIQFDYVRFPEAGRGGYIGYSFNGDSIFSREEAITNFVAALAEELHSLGVKVSLDIFGIVVWEDISWKLIGQNIRELAKYVDVIYPMPYPSHFGPGWGGHRNPADEPYFFVQETAKKFLEQTQGTGVKIRPWLQGFTMRVTRFGPKYIQEQVRALHDIGIEEFSVWNAANNYSVTLKALE